MGDQSFQSSITSSNKRRHNIRFMVQEKLPKFTLSFVCVPSAKNSNFSSSLEFKDAEITLCKKSTTTLDLEYQ